MMTAGSWLRNMGVQSLFDAVKLELMELFCLDQSSRRRHSEHVVMCYRWAFGLGAMRLAPTTALAMMWRVLFMYVQFEATSTTSGSKSAKNMWRELKRLAMWRRKK